jgi:GT2 family glycosyltransferase
MRDSVSIIIVNYNSGDYLPRCLASVFAQTWQDFEVIVVDNASADGSMRHLDEYPQVVRIMNAENRGFAAAQNQGLRVARGEYLMPLNFDIVLAPRFLGEMVSAMESNEKVGSVSCKMLRMTPAGEPTGLIGNAGLLLPRRRFPVHRGGGEKDAGQYDRPARVFGAMGAAALYRREMLEDIAYRGQFFDESYFMWYEDIDLEWRARLRGWDCVYTPGAVAYHVGDPHGHGRSKFGAETSMRNRWKMILSNECPHCLLRNAPSLLAEELALLRHVIRHGLIGAYGPAARSCLAALPATLDKRRLVRGRAMRRCLPEYPQPLEESH